MIQRAGEALLLRPTRMLAVIALLVVVPLIVLGEFSADDTRRRLRAQELDATAASAERAAAAVAARFVALRDAALAGAQARLRAPLARGDTVEMQLVARDLRSLLGADIARVSVANAHGDVLVSEPFDAETLTRTLGATDGFQGVTIDRLLRQPYVSAPFRPRIGSALRRDVSITVPIRETVPIGVLVTELDLVSVESAVAGSRLAGGALYVVNRSGALVLDAPSAGGVPPQFQTDLTSSKPVATVLSGTPIRGEATDPVNGAPALVVSAPVDEVDWVVIAALPPTAADADVESALGQAQAGRLTVAVVILLTTFVLAHTSRRIIAQRQDLAERGRKLSDALMELEESRRQVALASQHKSEFLASMSHELRTPLNAIIGFSDVLLQRLFGDLNPKQADYLHDINESGKHQLTLVNEILDLSKVEAGRMELEPSEFALADTIRGALTFVRERAASHAIVLGDDSAPDLGTVVADERKVRQVLLNLLSNAVKFTPDGGRVAVHARRTEQEVQVSVQDTGIGIAPEDQPRVFEEFRQVGKTSDRSREGTGLGLTLAKRFIELHGGRIWIESEVGKGTTFTFALPVGRTASPN